MNIPEEHWQHAPVALPPITLPRGLVNRLNIDNGGDPLNAEWASAIIAYVLTCGLDALDQAETAPAPLAVVVTISCDTDALLEALTARIKATLCAP